MASRINRRSFTGHHDLLPAAEERRVFTVTFVSPHTLFVWTFGRGTVIWRIWPAVLMHTVFATVVTIVSMQTGIYLGIPNVMLTVLGVVIGFVISYRASSGYDRYWAGRSAWSDVMRNARTFTRLVWFHVPLRLTPRTAEETNIVNAGGTAPMRSHEEVQTIMREKRMALDLVDGFVVALKHHLRSELGIYYEDLYSLVKPFHEHIHVHHHHMIHTAHTERQELQQSPSTSRPSLQVAGSHNSSFQSKPKLTTSTSHLKVSRDPVIPSINSYGSINATPSTAGSSNLSRSTSINSFNSASSGDSSDSNERRPLLPASTRINEDERGVMGRVSGDLIPFVGVFRRVGWMVGKLLHTRHNKGNPDNIHSITGNNEDVETGLAHDNEGDDQVDVEDNGEEEGGVQRRFDKQPSVVLGSSSRVGAGPSGAAEASKQGVKHRPRVAGDGKNLPLEALRFLSDWAAVLEERGTVPGTSLGSMIGCLAAFEDSVSTLERILTTPLPFVFSVHIKHTVWIFLFFLPFQLVDLFGWSSIPGVAIAAFIYLGFLAAGEEIEQPFGYDENDLDLDLFCRDIVHADIERLKRTPCANVFLGSTHHSSFQPGQRLKVGTEARGHYDETSKNFTGKEGKKKAQGSLHPQGKKESGGGSEATVVQVEVEGEEGSAKK